MSRSRQRSRVRRWLAGLGVLSLVVATGVIPAASVAAAEPTDTVLDWNLNTVVALSNPLPTAIPAPPVPGAGQTPPVASQHLAMVQGAVYDAVNAIDGGHQPYLEGLPSAPATASKAAAAATAAHDVLVGLVPALPQVVKDRLDSLYADSLLEITDSADKTSGIAIGAAAAAAMLADRAGDGRYGSFTFPVGTGVGEWRPTSGINDPFAWVAKVRPFTLNSKSQFRTAGPPDVESAEYAAEFNEVKALGSISSTARTDAQTQLAKFYSVNPLPFMNRAFREIAAARGLSITEDARLFAMTSMSSADALIGCWDDKAYWHFWRPVTAIAEAENDGNPATSAEAGWTPLLTTPPYPEHPSGFNCFTAGMMYAGKNFFGTNNVEISFTTSAVTTPSTRTYGHLSAVLRDTIDARVWLGIHFRTPDVQGAWLGKMVANWVAKHYFEPVG